MTQDLNLFDLAFFTLTFVIAFVGGFRGLIKEISNLLVWIIAIAVSYFAAPYFSLFLSKYNVGNVAVYVSSRIILFIATFVVVHILISGFVKDFKKMVPTPFDKSFGLLFGILKSVLIFALISAAINNAVTILPSRDGDKPAPPKWLSEAKSRTILKIPVDLVDPLMKKCVKSIADNFYEKGSNSILDQKIDEVIDEEKNKSSGRYEDEVFDYGYSKKDIEKMNRLIDIVE